MNELPKHQVNWEARKRQIHEAFDRKAFEYAVLAQLMNLIFWMREEEQAADTDWHTHPWITVQYSQEAIRQKVRELEREKIHRRETIARVRERVGPWVECVELNELAWV